MTIDIPNPAEFCLPESSRKKTKPIYVVPTGAKPSEMEDLTTAQKRWLEETGYAASPGELALLPDDEGKLTGAVIAISADAGHWPKHTPIANLPKQLPEGNYHFENLQAHDEAFLYWLLGAYRFEQYKQDKSPINVAIKPAKETAYRETMAVAEAIWLGRDLINTPAEDLGPEELENAVRTVAKKHKAKVTSTIGEDLLKNNFPLVHTVGRASDRAPRLINMSWGKKTAPKVTIVGKGICFDTGGLNLKPGNAMLLMKKDMGGSAAALSLAYMIMSANLPVNLRLIIAAADNNVSSNAFRAGDVYTSRAGINVEISNTDAEGRLVLADALALADEEEPDYLFDFATLTGAARVAMGPDLPPFYSTDDDLAAQLTAKGQEIGDPIWRLPLWDPYERMLRSSTGDINHCGDSPFAGSITAALFLKKFVAKAKHYTHFDIYGWTPSPLPGKPKGGEPQAARAVYAVLRDLFK